MWAVCECQANSHYFRSPGLVSRVRFTWVFSFCLGPFAIFEISHFIPLIIEHFMYERMTRPVFYLLGVLFVCSGLLCLLCRYRGTYIFRHLINFVTDSRTSVSVRLLLVLGAVALLPWPLMPIVWVLWRSKEDQLWNRRIVVVYIICAYGPMTVYVLLISARSLPETNVVLACCIAGTLWVILCLDASLQTLHTSMPLATEEYRHTSSNQNYTNSIPTQWVQERSKIEDSAGRDFWRQLELDTPFLSNSHVERESVVMKNVKT